MRTLVLDPANSTGYCVYSFDQKTQKATIEKWGYIDIENLTDYDGDRYLTLLTHVERLINENDIDQVAVEDYFFSRRTPQGANLNCSYRAMIHMKCRELKMHYEVLNISLWKKFIAGRSTSTKEQKKKWGNEASKKLMIQEALYTKYDIRFPNHSLSKLTGKPIKFRYDIVDAVAMAIFHASIYMHSKSIGYNVIMIDDIEFKKVPKGTFDYGGING